MTPTDYAASLIDEIHDRVRLHGEARAVLTEFPGFSLAEAYEIARMVDRRSRGEQE